METLLMSATLVALALAIGMSVLAWKLLREDRQRAAARSEALQAMAAGLEPPDAHASAAPVLADQPPIIPARARAEETLEAWDWELGAEHAASRQAAAPRLSKPAPAPERIMPDGMFGATIEHGAPSRRWVAVASVAAVMALLAGGVYTFYGPQVASASSERVETATTTAPGGPRPLELLSLRHSADPDGSFTVTGLVQNPFEGHPVRRVAAVVYLFDRDGNYFASGKAALDFTVLQPGDESPFVVHVPNVGRVSRYRVGFRTEEGGVVTHIDRRGQLPGGTTGDAIDSQGSRHPAVSSTVAPRRSEG